MTHKMHFTPLLIAILLAAIVSAEDKKTPPLTLSEQGVKTYLKDADAILFTEAAAYHFQQDSKLNLLAGQFNEQSRAAQDAKTAYGKVVEDLRVKLKQKVVCRLEATGELLPDHRYAWVCPAEPPPAAVSAKETK